MDIEDKYIVEKGFGRQGVRYEEGDVIEIKDEEKAENVKEGGFIREPESEEEVKNANDPTQGQEKTDSDGITDEQNKKIHKLYDMMDIDSEKFLEDRYGVKHTDELSKEQASKAIDELEAKWAIKDSEMNDEEIENEQGEVELPDSMKLPSGEEGQKVALELEKKDDVQIANDVAQIPEKAIEDWFYQFKNKGRTVTGLSYKGVMALMRKQQNIDVKVLENKDKGDHYKVKARAIDKARNITFERIKRQPKKMERKSGNKVKDEFADVKAESKAIKKALEAVISPRVVVRAYEKWQKSKGIK